MGSDAAAGLGDVEALSVLADRTRRGLYELVARSDHPVSREECAQALRLDRSLAAYHLDKLLEYGYLEATYERQPGRRGGPGLGRPPKLYRRSSRAFVSRVPARDYRLLAELVVAAADEAGPTARQAITRAARNVGRNLATAASEARGRQEEFGELLDRHGYEPYEAEPGLVRLRNCPFDAVASRHPGLVCALNHALIEGMLSALGAEPDRALLAPQDGCCCVAIRTSALAGAVAGE